MKVKITVTKEDIKKGWRDGDIKDCPIALALCRKIKTGVYFNVWSEAIELGLSNEKIYLKGYAEKFSSNQATHSRSFKKKPFSFYLDIPKKYLRAS